MPDPAYPPGLSPEGYMFYQMGLNEAAQQESDRAQIIMGLAAVGAFAAASIVMFLEAGSVMAAATPLVGDTEASANSYYFEQGRDTIDKMIADELLASGRSSAEVQKFIEQCAIDRELGKGIYTLLEAEAIAAAYAADIMEHTSGAFAAGLILAGAAVQEQAALHAFFTSGL